MRTFRVVSSRRIKFASLLLVSTGVQSLTMSAACAQTGPIYQYLDENSVDLSRGILELKFEEGSIGSGDSRISLVRSREGFADFTSLQWNRIKFEKVTSGPNGGTATIYVTLADGYVDTFSGGSFTTPLSSTRGTGATLSQSYGSAIYQAADGTKIEFTDPTGGESATYCQYAYGPPSSCPLQLTSITSPRGAGLQFGWEVAETGYSPAGVAYHIDRLSSISNTAGYSIGLEYSNALGSGQDLLSASKFYNLVANPSTPQGTITYSYPAPGLINITNMAGEVWQVSAKSIRRPGETSPSFVANSAGPVTSVTRDGVTTSYSRSVTGSTATMTVTNALNEVTTVVSSVYTGMPTSISRAGNTTSFSYDTFGRVTQITQPEQNYVSYTYDARGNVTQTLAAAKPNSNVPNVLTSATYDPTCTHPAWCNKPQTTTDARGFVTNYTYDNTHGGVLSMQAPAPVTNGVRPETRYSWTQNNGVYQLTGVSACQTTASCVGTADEVKTSLVYDARGNVTSLTSGSGNGTLSQTQAMTYDAVGNLLTIDGPLPGSADTTRLRYDAARRRIGAISADPDGGGALKHRAVRTTFVNARETKTEVGTVNSQSDGDWAAFSPAQASEITYDSNGRASLRRLTSGGNAYQLDQTSYDALGRIQCVAQRMNSAEWGSLPGSACDLDTEGPDGPDRIVKGFYDASGRLTKTTAAFGTPAAADAATYTYSANDKVLSATDAQANRTDYEYDGHDRIWRTFYPRPEVGANWANGLDFEQLTYDAASNITQRRRRDNRTIDFAYDNLNRLTGKSQISTVWWETNKTYGYDLLGRMTSAGDSNGHNLTFTYDALGRRTSEASDWYGTMTSAYDIAGRRTSLQWPDGFYVSYDHLVTGEMSLIREYGPTSGGLVLATFGYDDLGRRISLTRGNGTVTSYGYDPVSRLSTLTDNLAGTAGDVTRTFSYNVAGQIASSTRDNDAYAWTAHANVDRNYTVNGRNQLTSSGVNTLDYDVRGNLSYSGGDTYAYTIDNQLAVVDNQTTSRPDSNYAYDPLGRLFHESAPNSVLMYDGTNMVMERDANGPVVRRRYVFGPGVDEPLVWYEGSGTADRRWLHPDERGSIVSTSNASGSALAIKSYDEYGIPGAGDVGRFQYTGQMWLPELGMYHYKARTYSPSLGRFMQTDPIGYADGMNFYAYVKNDPVNFVDPTGLSCEEFPGGWYSFKDLNRNGKHDDGEPEVEIGICGGSSGGSGGGLGGLIRSGGGSGGGLGGGGGGAPDCYFCFERLGLPPLSKPLCEGLKSLGSALDKAGQAGTAIGTDVTLAGVLMEGPSAGASTPITGLGLSMMGLSSMVSLTGNMISATGTGNFDNVLAKQVASTALGVSKSSSGQIVSSLLGTPLDSLIDQAAPNDCR